MSDENLPAVTEADLKVAGFPSGMQMAAGLAVFFNDNLYKRCSSLAVRMSEAATDGVLPKHLAGRPAACFAIVSRAISWNMDVFAVAQSTYQTPGGSIGYEGKLISAVLENSGKLDGGLHYKYEGDWRKVKGKFKIETSQKGGKYPVPTWTREDAAGLYVIVSAQVKGEPERRELRVDLDECFPLNSPLWATSPATQITYLAARRFGNVAMPGVLLGIPFDVDPVSFYGDHMTDITPEPKPPGKPKEPRKSEFDRPAAKEAEKPREAESKPKAAEPEPGPEPAVEATEQGQGADSQTSETSSAAAETVAVEATITEAETHQPTDEERKAAHEQDFSDWYNDMKNLVPGCRFVRDVTELREAVIGNLEGPRLKEFNALCDARQRGILNATRRPAPAKAPR